MQNFTTHHKAKYWLLCAIMILIAFGFIPSQSLGFRVGKTLLAEWLVLLAVPLFFVRHPWLKAFVVWCVLRHIIGVFEMSGAPQAVQVSYHKWSYITLNTVFAYSVFLEVLSRSFDNRWINKILDIFCVIGFVTSLLIILQYFGVWIAIIPKSGLENPVSYFNGWVVIASGVLGKADTAFTGPMDNVNLTSSLLCICFPAFLRAKRYWYLPVVFIGLFLAKSLGGIVPVIIVCALYGLLTNWRIGVALLGIGILLFLGAISNDNISNILGMSGRVEIWKQIWTEIVPLKPMIGNGLGQFKIMFAPIQTVAFKHWSSRFLQAHNDYLQVVVELGGIGLMIALAFFMSIIRKAVDEKKLIPLLGVIAGLLNCSVHFLFETPVAGLFLVYVAMILFQKKTY